MSTNTNINTHTSGANLDSLPNEILVMVLEYLLPIKLFCSGPGPELLNLSENRPFRVERPHRLALDNGFLQGLRGDEIQSLIRLHQIASRRRDEEWERRRQQYMYWRRFHPEIMRVSRRIQRLSNYVLYEHNTLPVLLAPGPRHRATLRVCNAWYRQYRCLPVEGNRDEIAREEPVWSFLLRFKKIRLVITASWEGHAGRDWDLTSIYRFIWIASPLFQDKSLTIVFDGLPYYWAFDEPGHADDIVRAFTGLRCQQVAFEGGQSGISDDVVEDAVRKIQGRTKAFPGLFFKWSELDKEARQLYSSRIKTAKVWDRLSLMRQAVRYADEHSFSLLRDEILKYFEQRRRRVISTRNGPQRRRVGQRELDALHRSTDPPTIRRHR